MPKRSVSAAATATAIATSVATASVAASAAATAAVAAARRTGLIDSQASTAERTAVESFNGRQRFRVGAHLDESEALGAVGISLHHDLGAGDRTVLAESLLKIVVANGVGEVARGPCAHRVR